MSNKLRTSYSSMKGMGCRTIGPETLCFCMHSYKHHKTEFDILPKERPIKLPCQQNGCKCKSYHFVPYSCCQTIRCTCKHEPQEHSEEEPFQCKKGGCTKCTGFASSYPCGCGLTYNDHKTVVETPEEREARRQITPYAAQGGGLAVYMGHTCGRE